MTTKTENPPVRRFAASLFAASVLGVSAAHAQWSVTNLHPTGSAESVAMGVGGAGGTPRIAGYAAVGSAAHACVWGTTAASWIDLHPVSTGVPNSIAYATDGAQQVGVLFTSSPIGAASIWTGTAASWMNITPAFPFGTGGVAYGVANGQQVGSTTMGGTNLSRQGTVWNGATIVSNGNGTAMLATDGTVRVGYGGGQGFPVPSPSGAGMWVGTSSSGVSLHPVAAYSSSATGVSGAQQVGWFQSSQFNSTRRACLWASSAASVVDLHPAGGVTSEATGVSAGVQVGVVNVVDPSNPNSTVTRAAMWTGTAGSHVNLHALLPSGFVNSVAKGVWSAAGTTRIVGGGFNSATGRNEALLWTFVGGSSCDTIDFNGDGLLPDVQDIADFLSVFAGGVCAGQQPANPPCNTDIDFNNDGLLPDVADIDSLLNVFAGGACL